MIINRDPIWDKFNSRLSEALCRDKFLREEPVNATPGISCMNKRYYFDNSGRNVFVCYHKLLFEQVFFELWAIAREKSSIKRESKQLLLDTYKRLLLNRKISEYSYSSSFEKFYEVLVEESYLYFDDLKNQYYFNLFRKIDNTEKGNEFTGGFLHGLTKHFSGFNIYHPISKETVIFDYKSFMVNLILCSINGKIVKTEDVPKIKGNFKLTRMIELADKNFKVTLYWDNQKELFYVTTFWFESK